MVKDLGIILLECQVSKLLIGCVWKTSFCKFSHNFNYAGRGNTLAKVQFASVIDDQLVFLPGENSESVYRGTYIYDLTVTNFICIIF